MYTTVRTTQIIVFLTTSDACLSNHSCVAQLTEKCRPVGFDAHSSGECTSGLCDCMWDSFDPRERTICGIATVTGGRGAVA